MATQTTNKKYLDLEGLSHLIDKLNDEKRLTAHPKAADTTPAAVKVGMDADGHVKLGAALSYNDLQDKPVIGNGTLTIKANGTSKGTFTANQTGDSAINITAADLGLGNALHFKGTTTTAIADGASTNPILIGGNNYTAVAGDVVLYSNKEFIWNGTGWEELGDESSHALKSITVIGTGALEGGGDLSQNREITHKKSTAATAAAVKIGRDEYGHVVIGTALTTAQDGKHGHSVTTSVPASTFLKSATANTTKISLNKDKDTFLKSYSGVSNKLVTTQIAGVSGSTTASKATAITAKDVAKAGEAVVYGTANVGEQKTVATRAASATTVGNANVGAEVSILGVKGSTTASKATKGTAVAVATVGQAVTVATRSTETTKVGNANVGSQITLTGVEGSTTASKATAGDAKNIAKVGTAVVYGTADCGTAITGVAKVGSQITYGAANCGTAVNVTEYNSSKPAYTAAYNEDDECLTLTALGYTSITPAIASSTKAYVCADGTGVSITPAKAAPTTQKIIPAVDNGTITPYTFADVTVPVAAGTATKFTPAVSSSTEIYTVGGVTDIIPAVDNGTITPYTFADVAVPVAAETATKFTPAIASSTEIYGVAGTVTVTSAVAAPNTQKIVPAVANGTITPYTFADVTVPVAAAAINVATGKLDANGSGDLVLTGLGTATTADALTSATIQSGTSGDVIVATGVSTSGNDLLTLNGQAAENGEHNHTVQ